MKKLIICVLMLALCLSAFAGCGSTEEATPVDGLANAKEYLYTMYKNSPVTTPADYKVVGRVVISGVTYEVAWTADSDTVKFVKGEDGFVTVDVDEANPEELHYKLTATLTNAEGKTESITFEHKVPAAIIIEEGISYAEIVDLAYKLEDGLAMDGTFRLCGTITKIDTPWSADYQNITVTIAIAGKEDMPIMCYRLKGEGADKLAVGEVITAEGVVKNYNGTIEFDAGCTLDYVHSANAEEPVVPAPENPVEIVNAAYALKDGEILPYTATLTGKITEIGSPYSEQYGNITVTIAVADAEDKPIVCFRLKGDGADKLAVGDTITVTGTIKNYQGTIEFDAGCKLDAVTK